MVLGPRSWSRLPRLSFESQNSGVTERIARGLNSL